MRIEKGIRGLGAHARDRRIDLIRGIAVLGMVFVNTKYLFSAQSNGEGWLVSISGLLDGRPAALFIVLAGIGVSIMARSGKNRADLMACRAKLLKRAVVLFAAGLVLLEYWTADILHFYGIYLPFAAVLVGAGNRVLAFLAAFFLSLSIWIHFVPDFSLLPSLETDCDGFLECSRVFVWDLILTGCYPVVPCLGLFFSGMWLGRHDLSSPRFRRKLFVFGLFAVVAAILTKKILIGSLPLGYLRLAFDADIFLISSDPFPPSAFYLLSAGGLSLLIIAGCCGLSAQRMNNRLLEAVCDTGRASLSVYVFHIMVCGAYLDIRDILSSDYSLAGSILIAFAWCVGAVSVVRIWLKRFPYAPLEWVLRAISKPWYVGNQVGQGI